MKVIERLKCDYDLTGDLECVITKLQDINTLYKPKYTRVFLSWERYGYDGGGSYNIMGERKETSQERDARLLKIEKDKNDRLLELEKRQKDIDKERLKIEQELQKLNVK